MSEASFINALRVDYASLKPADRKQKIRELVAESEKNKRFIQKFFPEFYAEAFPSRPRAAGRTWAANSRPGRRARLR